MQVKAVFLVMAALGLPRVAEPGIPRPRLLQNGGLPPQFHRAVIVKDAGATARVISAISAAVVVLVAVVSIRASVAQAQDAPPGFRAEFLHQFDQSMGKVLALAEAVPAETYARRPVPAVMPLAQMFAHIARFNYEYPARAMGISTPSGIDRDTLERVATKAQVVALLRCSAEHVREAVRRMPEAQLGRVTILYGRRVPQWAVLLQLIAHLNDHLGQTIAYARVSGVIPPWSQ